MVLTCDNIRFWWTYWSIDKRNFAKNKLHRRIVKGFSRYVEYFALVWSLKRHWEWIMQREHEYANMKQKLRKFSLIRLLQLYFILLPENLYFTAKMLVMHIISIKLTCMEMYVEAYLEPSRTSMVELVCKNHKKSLL